MENGSSRHSMYKQEFVAGKINENIFHTSFVPLQLISTNPNGCKIHDQLNCSEEIVKGEAYSQIYLHFLWKMYFENWNGLEEGLTSRALFKQSALCRRCGIDLKAKEIEEIMYV